MTDDVVVNKAASLERCLKRVREEYQASQESPVHDRQTHEDAMVLNLLRACEAVIDLAIHLVRKRGLGAPQSSRDAFRLLHDAAILDGELAERMQRMVGFRNIAVHNYRQLDRAILSAIVTARLDDFRHFARVMLRLE